MPSRSLREFDTEAELSLRPLATISAVSSEAPKRALDPYIL